MMRKPQFLVIYLIKYGKSQLNLLPSVNYYLIMKTKNVKKNKAKQLILKMLIGAVIGLSFGFGVGKMVKSNDDLVTSIEKNLQHTYWLTTDLGARHTLEKGLTNFVGYFLRR